MSAVDDDNDDVATTVRAPLDVSAMALPARRRRPRPTPTTAPPPMRFAQGTSVLPHAAIAPRPRPPSPTLAASPARAPTLVTFPSRPARLRGPLPLPMPPPRLRSQPDAQPRAYAPLAWHWTVLAALVSLAVGFVVAFSLVSFLA